MTEEVGDRLHGWLHTPVPVENLEILTEAKRHGSSDKEEAQIPGI